MKNYTIAVAGTGYVGLSIATLLSQNHKVYAVDIVPEKVELINNRKSPIPSRLYRGVVLIPVFAAITITRGLAMGVTVCPKIPNSFWRTMRMCLRT